MAALVETRSNVRVHGPHRVGALVMIVPCFCPDLSAPEETVEAIRGFLGGR